MTDDEKGQSVIIEDEIAYPIYHESARWIQDGEHTGSTCQWEGLPEGRIWNDALFHYRMFKEEQSRTTRDLRLLDWWGKYKTEKLAGKNPTLIYLRSDYAEHEVWCLEWFQHFTFGIGTTDEQVLESFQKFVDRKNRLNDRNRGEPNYKEYCLMGAEDRWRWKGSQDGDPKQDTPPPCRCEHCKKHGLIRIGH